MRNGEALRDCEHDLEILCKRMVAAESEVADARRERDQCLDALRQIYQEYGEDARIAEICDPLISGLSCSA